MKKLQNFKYIFYKSRAQPAEQKHRQITTDLNILWYRVTCLLHIVELVLLHCVQGLSCTRNKKVKKRVETQNLTYPFKVKTSDELDDIRGEAEILEV
jgi:hypothetical protein